MSVVVVAPLASEVVLLTLPSMPTKRPAWAESDTRFDERGEGGAAATCWRRTVETEVGDLLVVQWVWCENDGTVNVTRAFWDSQSVDFELTGAECEAMALAMSKVADHVHNADHAALAVAGELGDPWVTVAEGAERCGMKPWPLRELAVDGQVASVKVGGVMYVRAADLPLGQVAR